MIFEKLFGKKTKQTSTSKDKGEIPSADVVAIAMALHLF